MALKSCNECGGQMSSRASLCPHCGCNAPISKSALKVLIVMSVTATLVFGLLTFASRNERGRSDALVDHHFRLAAEDLVADRLRAPGSAIFAPPDEWIINRITDTHAELISWVDAQNPFGALLREHFVAEVYLDAAGDYELSYLSFDNVEEKFGEPHSQSISAAWQDVQDQAKRAAAEKERQHKKAAAKAEAGELAAKHKRMRQQAEQIRETARENERLAAAERVRRLEQERLARIEQQRKFDDELKRVLAEEKAAEDAKYRTWKSVGGKHSTEAKIISYGAGMVTLENRSGERIKVAVDRLSDEDRDFIAKWRDERRKP